MKFHEIYHFLTFGVLLHFFRPPEGEILAYQLKVMALGAEMEEIHQISLKMENSEKLAEIT